MANKVVITLEDVVPEEDKASLGIASTVTITLDGEEVCISKLMNTPDEQLTPALVVAKCSQEIIDAALKRFITSYLEKSNEETGIQAFPV